MASTVVIQLQAPEEVAAEARAADPTKAHEAAVLALWGASSISTRAAAAGFTRQAASASTHRSMKERSSPPTNGRLPNRQPAELTDVKPTGTENPRRKMGSDVIVIAADFDAPLSSEEEERFGL